MKAFAAVLLCALAAGGAALPAPSAPIPSLTPPQASLPIPTPSGAPSASPPPSAAASPSITCVSDHVNGTGVPLADECPSAIAAVEVLVARLGSLARIRIDPGFFDCGDLWPGVGSPPVCPGPASLPGSAMHGWASFEGTDKVAAISLYRSAIDPSAVEAATFDPDQANATELPAQPVRVTTVEPSAERIARRRRGRRLLRRDLAGPVTRAGPLRSEMHPDDDFEREGTLVQATQPGLRHPLCDSSLGALGADPVDAG